MCKRAALTKMSELFLRDTNLLVLSANIMIHLKYLLNHFGTGQIHTGKAALIINEITSARPPPTSAKARRTISQINPAGARSIFF